MHLKIPRLSLVTLIGPSGSGKSSFTQKHFLPTEVLSSDFCRGLVSDDENAQSATDDAFEVLHYVAAKRLRRGLLTVVDATNVRPEDRRPLIELARRFHVVPVAIVLALPERVCHARNTERPDRQFGPHVIRRQSEAMRRSLRDLKREGFRHVWVLHTEDDVNRVTLEREPLWTDRRHEHGPFDIIGDVHGCFEELVALLRQLGWKVSGAGEDAGCTGLNARHPDGRKAVFLGDLVDRGPEVPAVLRLVMNMVAGGTAICVPGNHDIKVMRWLLGKNVKVAHGLQETIDQFEGQPAEFREEVRAFVDGLISHFVLDEGRLVVAHAGMKEEYQGRASGAVREFALYGETTGETDEFGLPVRYPWAQDYRGEARVVYGHTPIPEPEWLNRTLCLDTGCVFGGKLTALRYPELELLSVPALQQYAVPARPFLVPSGTPILSAQHEHDDVLDLADFAGKRLIETELHGKVTIREENGIAALEVLSRFAANPRWLLYLPPTMSPTETSMLPGRLEHPSDAFAHFRGRGVAQVVCEEKHMGSRAVVVLCRDEDVARKRFGVKDEGIGTVYTRTGRQFFDDKGLEQELLHLTRRALEEAGLWTELETDWICLDCELMPWSAKAQGLIAQQYAPVAAAGRSSLQAAADALAQAAASGLDVAELIHRTTDRQGRVAAYARAYRQYCWEVKGLADLKLAPFHLLAAEGRTFLDRDHVWHMETLKRACHSGDGVLLATPYRTVDLSDPDAEAAATAWWDELTSKGGEGMVVKPLSFVTRVETGRAEKSLVQPALKCRGPEYLRIIYGPEYDAPEHLDRLRKRGVGAKRSLALREFSLGVEGLQRFVQREPLRRVHECVFGVLALESEPVDPRL